MEHVLLHSCCAPCSAAILEWMLSNDIRPTIFYCNPNIFPEEEYRIRKNEITRYADQLGLDIIDEDSLYGWEENHRLWCEHIHGLESEPERGGRCLECFRLRLKRTAEKARELGIRRFTTTLASSRWKNLEQINAAGMWAATQVEGTEFWDRNWRKGGLQVRRGELLKENGFYNQLYCGCEYSLTQREKKETQS